MRVRHHTRNATGEPGWVADLDELLADSDVLSVHVPLTDSTRGLIDRRRIGLLGTDAVLVNTAVWVAAVVSVTAGVVEPRYPSFKGIMAAKSKPVDEVKVADLGIDPSIVGWAGAGQEIVAVDKAEERQAGTIIEDDGEGYQKIVEALENLKVI